MWNIRIFKIKCITFSFFQTDLCLLYHTHVSIVAVVCNYTCITIEQIMCKSNKAIVPSVLWRCWLGGRKGIRPVKNWVVGCGHGYLSGARCRVAYGPADAIATHCLFASVKSRLVLPLWYRLTWVVPDKGPLNGCVCLSNKGCVCLSNKAIS